MGGLDDLKIAELSPEDIEIIQSLEDKLGPGIRLVAVKSDAILYALEAKMGPNHWERVDRVYPEISGIQAYFADEGLAKEAKAMLKGFIVSNKLSPKPKKRPIRVRQIVNTER
jgi:hypothetical protein